MAVEIRNIRDDEIDAYRDVFITVFGDDPDGDPGGAARQRALIPHSQAWVAVEGGSMVGTTASYDLDVVVPGGTTMRMAGLTLVTVRPSHRRRGILTQLMRRHLDDARERGFPASGLWASESSIYRRFGYGVAAEADALEIKNAHALAVAEGREVDTLDWLDERRARELLPAVYEQAVRDRPGALIRSEVWWRERRFIEAPFARAGASKRRHIVARRGDQLTGYLVYRQRAGNDEGILAGKVEIVELIATDPRAEATLWRCALSMDLFPTVSWSNAPVDDPLPWLVPDPRRIKRRRVDTLWLRIEDVAATLSARRYASDGALRIGVEDAGVYELAVADGKAACTKSSGMPELEVDRATLGSLFLAGFTASRLARAGLVRGSARAVAAADRLFGWPVAPWCPEVF